MYFETTAAGGISWEEVQESQLKGDEDGGSKKQARKKLSISIPKWCGKWVVPMDEYRDGVVGAKSKNLAGGLDECRIYLMHVVEQLLAAEILAANPCIPELL